MTTKIEPLMTIADLEAMPDDGNRYEIIEGELFVSRAPGLTHQIVSDNIVFLVRNYLELNPIGVVVSTPGLILSDYSGVIPDIVFFSNKTREKIVSGERLISAPDLLIEILSAGSENIRRDRVAKRQLYAKHAVPEYWLVDHDQRVVEIYLLRAASLELTATLQNDDELSTTALPGFSCATNQIFKLPQL
jgi:Uma2 family endonuclease